MTDYQSNRPNTNAGTRINRKNILEKKEENIK